MNFVLIAGIGYGMVIISAIVCIYYNIIITWTLYYFFKSLQAHVPWATCNNEWNTEECSQTGHRSQTLASIFNASRNQNSSLDGLSSNNDSYGMVSGTIMAVNETMSEHKVTPSEQFWE